MSVDRSRLLAWYRSTRRALPWREAPTPYAVWLCEVMSQQTRIETMLPYWRRFLARWPTAADLAAASLEEVLSEWSGLGYYSRARNLHAAARVVADGGLPQTAKGWRELPGVGRYTAAAITSIALGHDEAVVDGNVERVICRVEDIAEDPRGSATRKRVEAFAFAWLARGSAGDWNQALMELGARLCTPKKPECAVCPLAEDCKALEAGTVLERPNKPRKQKQREVSAIAAVIRRSDAVWMARRPLDALLGGLWELPSGVDLAQLRARCGHVVLGETHGSVRHVFSHRKLTLTVRGGRLDAPAALDFYTEGRWLSDPESVPLSKLTRKTLELLES